MTISKVNNIDIDEFDKQILDLLQNDAKLTIASIAEKIDKSPTAVRARIQKLEKVLIKKYVALIDCRQLGYREMVMASLRVNSSFPLAQSTMRWQAAPRSGDG